MNPTLKQIAVQKGTMRIQHVMSWTFGLTQVGGFARHNSVLIVMGRVTLTSDKTLYNCSKSRKGYELITNYFWARKGRLVKHRLSRPALAVPYKNHHPSSQSSTPVLLVSQRNLSSAFTSHRYSRILAYCTLLWACSQLSLVCSTLHVFIRSLSLWSRSYVLPNPSACTSF